MIHRSGVSVALQIFTFRMRRFQGKMCIGHGHLCVCVCPSVSCRIPTLLHGPRCNLGNSSGHYCALLGDLQLVHGFSCYDNIAPNAKCQQVLVLALCLVVLFVSWPAGAESVGASEVGRQQRVMIIGNNNVFEVGCCILFISVIFIFGSAFFHYIVFH